MVLAPTGDTTQRVMASNSTFLPLATVYTVLLWLSWEADTLSLMMPGSLEAGLRGECCHLSWAANPGARAAAS